MENGLNKNNGVLVVAQTNFAMRHNLNKTNTAYHQQVC
jgi:hypothetical protein